jgi:hypothetical protein
VMALYSPTTHRRLWTRFGQDIRVVGLCRRSMALWSLGYPNAALADTNNALNDAREIGQAATLFMAPFSGSWLNTVCGNTATASALANELAALADEKDAAFWKVCVILVRGCAARYSLAIATISRIAILGDLATTFGLDLALGLFDGRLSCQADHRSAHACLKGRGSSIAPCDDRPDNADQRCAESQDDDA